MLLLHSTANYLDRLLLAQSRNTMQLQITLPPNSEPRTRYVVRIDDRNLDNHPDKIFLLVVVAKTTLNSDPALLKAPTTPKQNS